MPVRTDRGRVAVYRKIWGWPLRSPRHLAATVAAVLLLVAAVAVLASAVAGPPAPTTVGQPAGAAVSTGPRWTSTATSAPETIPTTTPAQPPAASTAPVPPTTVTPAPTGTAAASAIAGEFMRRWVHHPAGTTSQQWAAQLTPYVVPEYVVELESVEPSNIPATAVTGEPVVTSATPTVVEVNVPTNGGMVHLVVLAQRDGTWLVRSYDLAAG